MANTIDKVNTGVSCTNCDCNRIKKINKYEKKFAEERIKNTNKQANIKSYGMTQRL